MLHFIIDPGYVVTTCKTELYQSKY